MHAYIHILYSYKHLLFPYAIRCDEKIIIKRWMHGILIYRQSEMGVKPWP